MLGRKKRTTKKKSTPKKPEKVSFEQFINEASEAEKVCFISRDAMRHAKRNDYKLEPFLRNEFSTPYYPKEIIGTIDLLLFNSVKIRNVSYTEAAGVREWKALRNIKRS